MERSGTAEDSGAGDAGSDVQPSLCGHGLARALPAEGANSSRLAKGDDPENNEDEQTESQEEA